MSPDIPMDDKQLKQPADDQKNAFYSGFDIHFNPVFNHFLKGTELKGRVSATLMKKFGDKTLFYNYLIFTISSRLLS